jgi:hypothetical protein
LTVKIDAITPPGAIIAADTETVGVRVKSASAPIVAVSCCTQSTRVIVAAAALGRNDPKVV